MLKQRVFAVLMVFVLLLGMLITGCGKKKEKATESKVDKGVTTKETETTETVTEAQTPKDQAVTDLDTAQNEVSEAISEVETELKEIDKIDTNQDNESGY